MFWDPVPLAPWKKNKGKETISNLTNISHRLKTTRQQRRMKSNLHLMQYEEDTPLR